MVTRRKLYIPERGDIVWINFSPHRGHEQGGRRPAVVLSKNAYNKRTGLAILCPITSRVKGYPFEVAVHTKSIDGVALADQIKSLDLASRGTEFIAHLDPQTLNEIAEIAKELIFPS